MRNAEEIAEQWQGYCRDGDDGDTVAVEYARHSDRLLCRRCLTKAIRQAQTEALEAADKTVRYLGIVLPNNADRFVAANITCETACKAIRALISKEPT